MLTTGASLWPWLSADRVVQIATLDVDDTFRLRGSEMWISAGEHDLVQNIVHFVLARVAGAQAGVRSISLFLVPKVLDGQNREPGERNDISLVWFNHKMGFLGP